MRAPRRILITLTLACLSAAGCSGGGGGGPYGPGSQNPPPGGNPPPSNSAQVAVKNNRFDPASTTVNAGTTVVWTWDACDDDGYGSRVCVDHSVTFDNGGSQTQSTGSYSRQFTTAGTYDYRCTVHGTSMTGRVTVQ